MGKVIAKYKIIPGYCGLGGKTEGYREEVFYVGGMREVRGCILGGFGVA
jgi:hypothetical protein